MAAFSSDWKQYEVTATLILHQLAEHFRLARVEGKQNVPGHLSGTKYEIDGKGIYHNGEGFMIIECRCYSSRLKQKDACALAYEMKDAGAVGGMLVTPLDLQEGAKKVAKAAKIHSVTLNADATPEQFVLQFLGNFFVSILGDEMKMSGQRPGVITSVQL